MTEKSVLLTVIYPLSKALSKNTFSRIPFLGFILFPLSIAQGIICEATRKSGFLIPDRQHCSLYPFIRDALNAHCRSLQVCNLNLSSDVKSISFKSLSVSDSGKICSGVISATFSDAYTSDRISFFFLNRSKGLSRYLSQTRLSIFAPWTNPVPVCVLSSAFKFPSLKTTEPTDIPSREANAFTSGVFLSCFEVGSS